MQEQQKAQWIKWVDQLQALAQIGLTYCDNPFCKERYEKLRDITAEMAAEYSELSFEKIKNLFNQQYHYATPNIDLRAIVIKDKKILLVQETSDNLWSLPGGWADVETTPSENIKREVFEEAGFKVEVKKLLAFWDKLKHGHPPQIPHAYKAFFLCDIVGGKATTSIETTAVAFFDVDELPSMSMDRVTPEQIKTCYELSLDPNSVTLFD